MQAAQATLRQRRDLRGAGGGMMDASRTGYAEAKDKALSVVVSPVGCKPHRLR